MSKYRKLSHVVYKCYYHIVWVPKYRFRIVKGSVKDLLEEDIRMLCQWKGCDVEVLKVQGGHLHPLVSVPPRVSISGLIGTLKGKLAIKLFKSYPEMKRKPYWGNHFWARGVFCEHRRSGRGDDTEVLSAKSWSSFLAFGFNSSI